MAKLSRTEQETTINYNYEETKASVFTHDKRLITKLDKLCKSHPKEYKIERDDQYKQWGCKSYIIPKKMVSIRTPSKPLTEEQKLKRKQNMLKLHEQNKI